MKAKKLLAMILSLTMILGLCTVGAKANAPAAGRTLTVTIQAEGSTTSNTILHVVYSDETDPVDADLNTLFALAKEYVKDGDIINLPAGNIYFKTGSTSNEVNIFHSVTINGNAGGTTLYFCGQVASNDRCIRIQQIGSNVGNGPTVTFNNITLDGTNSTKQASAFYVKHSTLNMNNSTIKNFGDMNAFFLNARDEAYNAYHSTPEASMTVETQFDATINANNVTFSGVKNALSMEVYPSNQIKNVTTHAYYNYANCTYNDTKIVADGWIGYQNAISTETKGGDVIVTDLLPAAAKIGETFYATLQGAIDAAEAGDTIELLADIELAAASGSAKAEQLEVASGKNFTIDGKDHSISFNMALYAETKDSTAALFSGIGANALTSASVTVKDVEFINKTTNATNYSKVFATNSGSPNNFTLIGCTLKNVWSAAYLNGGSGTLTIKDCLYDSSILGGLWSDASSDYTISVTGCEYQAASMEVMNNTSVTIENNDFSAVNTIYVYNGNSAVKLDGNYWGGAKPTFAAASGSTGSISEYPSWFNAKTVVSEPATGTNFTLSKRHYANAVAEVDGEQFPTLAEAYDAAEAGDTITLLENVNLTETQGIEKNLTLDLNGKNITAADARALWVKSGEVSIVDNSTGSTKGTITTTKTEGSSLVSGSSVIRVGSTDAAKAAVTIGAGVKIEAPFTYGVTAFGTNENGVELVVNGTIIAHGTEAAISGNGNAGNKGAVTINEGAVITSDNAEAIYHPQGDTLTVKGGTITGKTGIYQKSGTLSITGGTINGNGAKAAYTSTGDDCVPTGDALVIDNCGYPGGAPVTTISGGTFNSVNAEAVASYAKEGSEAVSSFITGGTYSSDPNQYVAEGYIGNKITNTKYVVGPIVKIDSAEDTTTAKDEASGVTVTFETEQNDKLSTAATDMNENTSLALVIDKKADLTGYGITEDNTFVEDVIDITVKKTTVTTSGTETTTTTVDVPLTEITATVSYYFPNYNPNRVYKVYYFPGGSDAPVDMKATYNRNTQCFEFTINHNSEYGVVSTEIDADNKAESIDVVFLPTAELNVYDIALKANAETKYIHGFVSADLTFDLDVEDGQATYVIDPVTGVTSINDSEAASGRYLFNMDGIHYDTANGNAIKLGTVTFLGYGKIDFKVTDDATNVVNTTKLNDSIVEHYTVGGAMGLGINTSAGTTTLAPTAKIDDLILSPASKALTVNVMFPNDVANQGKAYQDMTMTISGGDLYEDIVINLGSDPTFTGKDFLNHDLAADAITVAYNGSGSFGATPTACNQYVVSIPALLHNGIRYTVTVEGAGYRTARYSINMAGDKSLTFWNNVMDANTVIERNILPASDVTATSVRVTYLAGDIVKDEQINIYDLSAVVSYFGTTGLTADNLPEYAKYDLNRDGAIDSIDVAYVLVSWGY